MKKDSKKALYESIMASVAKEVKKALNENNISISNYNGLENFAIRSIYNRGYINENDNIICDNIQNYNNINGMDWKSNIDSVKYVIEQVLRELPKYITVDDIIRDQKRIEKFAGKYAVTPADEQMYKSDYTLHLTDNVLNEIKNIQLLFNNNIGYAEGIKERVIFVLKQSDVARKLANVAKWISKVAIQINQNTPITAALGVDGEASDDTTIANRVYKIIEGNEEAMAFYEKAPEIRKYRIMDPAITILKASKYLY